MSVVTDFDYMGHTFTLIKKNQESDDDGTLIYECTVCNLEVTTSFYWSELESHDRNRCELESAVCFVKRTINE